MTDISETHPSKSRLRNILIAVGAAIAAAVGDALSSSEVGRWASMAAAGSFVVYCVDRLRDLERRWHASH